MAYPDFVNYEQQSGYKKHFIERYCRNKIYTFDGIRVFFSKQCFSHAFFKGERKNIFNANRAMRIDWIDVALKDNSAELYKGWDNKKKCIDETKRVCLVNGEYIVVIKMKKNKDKEAFFITAFVVDRIGTLETIRKGLKWQ